MNATLGKKLRFSDAVYAINTTPKTLRNWLQRDLVEIHTPKPEGGWAEYSFIDIAILALVREFVRFGVDVQSASGLANTAMTKFYPQLLTLQNPENMPAGVLASMWGNQRLYIYPSDDGDTWHLKHVALYDSHLDPRRNKGFDPRLPSGVATIRREHEPAPVFMSLDVETVLRTALERAKKSVDAGADND